MPADQIRDLLLLMHRLVLSSDMEKPSLVALLRLRPHPSLPTLIDLDVNDVRPTADWTVLDILLGNARRCIEGYHNFFAESIAQIARIAAHGDDPTKTMADA